MKKILGITGGIGAGKSFVANLFSKLGATVVDADKIAREILEPGGSAFIKVIKSFGKEILLEDGTIDRKKLANIVFSDPEKLELLNRLTHPAVFEEIENCIKKADSNVVCLDVPLLFTCDFPISCDKTLAVIAPKEMRIKRIIARDNCTREEAIARMMTQLSDDEFREKADICLVADGDEDMLRKAIAEIYKHLMER